VNNYSITVILPCRNNRAELEGHVETMLEWLPRVEQVVVVDSSTDGSLDYLREKLTAPYVELHSVPPGLYQAWNFGIERARADFCYFSTVGDSISAEGLVHLYEMAIQNSLDLVLSPPDMVEADGAPKKMRWPIHEYAKSIDKECFIMDYGETFLWLTAFLPYTILGSSAANLYRTSLLKANPFPTEFGHNCDAALGAKIASFVKMGITCKICSRFVTHGPGREIPAIEQAEMAKKFLTLLEEIRRMSPPEGATAMAMARYLLENKIMLLEWIAGLEPLAAVVKEQKGYIEILESQNAMLRDERETLSRMSAGIPLPFVKTGHLLSLKRFLKRYGSFLD
jgi:hypothetical protein